MHNIYSNVHRNLRRRCGEVVFHLAGHHLPEKKQQQHINYRFDWIVIPTEYDEVRFVFWGGGGCVKNALK